MNDYEEQARELACLAHTNPLSLCELKIYAALRAAHEAGVQKGMERSIAVLPGHCKDCAHESCGGLRIAAAAIRAEAREASEG